MARSIIVDVRKALVRELKAVLEASDSNAGVSCTYGWLGAADDKRREQIYTNRPRATHDPASLKTGRNYRNERMEFDLSIWVMDPSAPPEDVDERLMDLGQVVEEFVADNKNGEALGVPGLNWITVAGFELENRLGQTGSASLATYTIRYDARLT